MKTFKAGRHYLKGLLRQYIWEQKKMNRTSLFAHAYLIRENQKAYPTFITSFVKGNPCTQCAQWGGGGDILLMFIGSTVLREALVHKSEQKKTMFHNLQYGLRKQGLNNICSISEYNLRGMILIQINV